MAKKQYKAPRTYRQWRNLARKDYINGETIICSFCGSLLRPGTLVCPKCGQTVFDDPRRSRRDNSTYQFMKYFLYFWLFFLAPLNYWCSAFLLIANLWRIFAAIMLWIALCYAKTEIKTLYILRLSKFRRVTGTIGRLWMPVYIIGWTIATFVNIHNGFAALK